jgi:hypothetical protein
VGRGRDQFISYVIKRLTYVWFSRFNAVSADLINNFSIFLSQELWNVYYLYTKVIIIPFSIPSFF